MRPVAGRRFTLAQREESGTGPGPGKRLTAARDVYSAGHDLTVHHHYHGDGTGERPTASAPGHPVVAGDVPQVPRGFQAREDLIAALGADEGLLAVHVLTGIRGAGKTQLAAALAREKLAVGWRLVKPAARSIDGLAQREKLTDEIMPSQTFFDIAVIHLLTTSTINRLRELYPEGRFEVRRFRPNIVMESASGGKEFIENLWIGKNIMIGEEIVMRVMELHEMCDYDSAAGRPSQRLRYLTHGRNV